MQTASSAKRTCSELRSASEYTATVAMSSSLQAQMTRKAISPRLAMSILRNIQEGALFLLRRTDGEESLSVFHGLAVFYQRTDQFAAHVSFNFVHQFHSFN